MLRTLLLSEADLETRQKITGSMFGATKRLTQIFRKKTPRLLGIEMLKQSHSAAQPTALRPEPKPEVSTPIAAEVASNQLADDAAFGAPTLVTQKNQHLDHYETTKLYASK